VSRRGGGRGVDRKLHGESPPRLGRACYPVYAPRTPPRGP
jgi:hypothetical protein